MRPGVAFLIGALVLLAGVAALAIALVEEQQFDAVPVETVEFVKPVSWPPPISRTTTTTTIAPTTTTTQPRHVRIVSSTPAPSGRCGGDLPPCWVMQRESGGDINAYNPTGCGGRGCRGKWQCDPRTCSGTGTEAEQDAEARALWDNGRGCSHWAAC